MLSAWLFSKLFFLLLCVISSESILALPDGRPNNDLQKRQFDPGLVVDFQVYEPVSLPPVIGHDENGCVVAQTLMKHDFVNSYYQPFVGTGIIVSPRNAYD